MRLCQQDKVYVAERGVDSSLQFEHEQDAKKWLNAVRDTPWFRDNFPGVRYLEVQYDARQLHSVGCFEDGVVLSVMGPAHTSGLYLCHETAHGLCTARYGRGAHSPWFCRIYLELVYLLLGPATYAALRRAFEDHGVDHDPGPEFDHAPRGAWVA